MTDVLEYPGATRQKSWIDRALRPFGEVRAGEGITTLLMLVNIFLILVCYSVIKIVREPLILLGGGAEMRSYAAAGQALLLMGFVPFFSWFASRVDRLKLLVGVTLFFIVNIQLFALAVAANVIGANPSPSQHGVAVAGELIADKNGYGVTGGVFKARYKFHSHQSMNWASSVNVAAANSHSDSTPPPSPPSAQTRTVIGRCAALIRRRSSLP